MRLSKEKVSSDPTFPFPFMNSWNPVANHKACILTGYRSEYRVGGSVPQGRVHIGIDIPGFEKQTDVVALPD